MSRSWLRCPGPISQFASVGAGGTHLTFIIIEQAKQRNCNTNAEILASRTGHQNLAFSVFLELILDSVHKGGQLLSKILASQLVVTTLQVADSWKASTVVAVTIDDKIEASKLADLSNTNVKICSWWDLDPVSGDIEAILVLLQ